jgi:hypothetical protein
MKKILLTALLVNAGALMGMNNIDRQQKAEQEARQQDA